MANSESSPLLSPDQTTADVSPPENTKKQSPPVHEHEGGVVYGWRADGLPVSNGNVMGEPLAKGQWDSGLFACLGRNDEFCSSDLEVWRL
nr:hypothetical protein [Tanacetum cinerariifolium]